jgi:hypothetical protein
LIFRNGHCRAYGEIILHGVRGGSCEGAEEH